MTALVVDFPIFHYPMNGPQIENCGGNICTALMDKNATHSNSCKSTSLLCDLPLHMCMYVLCLPGNRLHLLHGRP